MRTSLIDISDPIGWRAALENLPHSIAHTHGFASCMARISNRKTNLFIAEGSEGKAVCPIAERSFRGQMDVYTPYGFGGFVGIGDMKGLREAWTQLAKDRGYVASYLMQNPVLMPPEVPVLWSDAIFSNRTLYSIDLKQSEEARWGRVSKRKRLQLRQWLQSVTPVTDQRALAAAFAELYPPFAKRRQMAEPYQFSSGQAAELGGLAETLLVGVESHLGKISCVALMGAKQDCGDYLFMASTPEGDEHGAGVLWLGLQALAERGISVCNLGGGIREGDGVSEMKRRLGGEAHGIPVIQEIFDVDRYKALLAEAGVSEDAGGYFPAYYKIAL